MPLEDVYLSFLQSKLRMPFAILILLVVIALAASFLMAMSLGNRRNDREAPRRYWFRFSLRKLFLLTTLAAIGIFLWHHAYRSQELFRAHSAKAYEHLMWHVGPNVPAPTVDTLATYQLERARHSALADYHIAMSEKYRREIWMPWVGFEADPAKPQEP